MGWSFIVIAMTIENIGTISYNRKTKEWFGNVDIICANNKVELTVSVVNETQDLTEKIELIKSFTNDCDSILADLYEHVYKSYNKTIHTKTLEEIKRMYFLTAVHLQIDNRTWYVTLEPANGVESIYNHFLRFTLTDRKIIWFNLA
jgi:hypothetical protein